MRGNTRNIFLANKIQIDMSSRRLCFAVWSVLVILVVGYTLSGETETVNSNNPNNNIVALAPPQEGNNDGGEVENNSPPPAKPTKRPPVGVVPSQLGKADQVQQSDKISNYNNKFDGVTVASFFNGNESVTKLTEIAECEEEYNRIISDPDLRMKMEVPPLHMFREHLSALQAHIALRTPCYAHLFKKYKVTKRTGRNVFIDMGSRMADSVSHFLMHYPNANSFEIHCFEANSDFNGFYTEPNLVKHRVQYHNNAISTTNTTLYLSDRDVGSSIVVAHTGGKQKPVQTINFNEFLLRHFQPGDFIIVKMDIEKAEFAVLHLLLKSFALLHIDHLLLECHCTTYVPPPRPKRLEKEIGRDECKKLSRDLNDVGMVSVDWSKRRTAAEYARTHGKWYPT
eukprot:PhF_6_TR26670/c0_g1_i1/m.38760